jgi:putative FmdB family regulatory protein
MPIYEYSCPKCGVFECRQKFTDEPVHVCPTCGEPVKKLIGRNIGIIYNSGGYYVSENRSSDYKKKQAEEKVVSPSPPASTDAKSKPAAE